MPGVLWACLGEGAHPLLKHQNLFDCCLACFLATVHGSTLVSLVHTL